MCMPHRQLNMKTRRLVVIANVSLAIGLLLWNFVHPSDQIERNWVHGVCGFLLGVSIAINLFGVILAHRCRAIASEPL